MKYQVKSVLAAIKVKRDPLNPSSEEVDVKVQCPGYWFEYLGYDFVAHRRVGRDRYIKPSRWVVTEPNTGLRATSLSGYMTRKEAVEEACTRLDANSDKLADAIFKNIAKMADAPIIHTLGSYRYETDKLRQR